MKPFILAVGSIVLIAFSFSCQKKSDSTPTPEARQNVIGTYYDSKTTIHINTTQIISALSAFTTVPAAFSINTVVSFGDFNSKFKIALDPTDGAKVLFRDTNQTSPTTLFHANSFVESSPLTTFYIPSQTISNTLLGALTSIPGISGLLAANPISIKGSPNFTYNSIGYDGVYNSGSKVITAYAKGQVNVSLGLTSFSFDVFTLTITGTKQ
jgi:hypothetical protein